MIRFDSPNPALLVHGRRAIRRAIMIEQAAERYAKSPRALGYFSPAEGADPADDEVIAELLADWNDARNTDAEGYVPASLKYNLITNPTPADLQLVQLQARASLDIANLIGLDPEDLGVSTTSRTYQNATDRRQDRINDVLAPYLRAITDRLSMNDVTRRGFTVGFDLRDYLKADPITRATVATQLSALGALTVEEIRADDGRPMLTPEQAAELAPPTSAPTPTPRGEPMPALAAVAGKHQAFTAPPARLTFTGPALAFRANTATRQMTGTILPYGAVGTNDAGRWRFTPGSVTWDAAAVSRIKLNRDHDRSTLLGVATGVTDSDTEISGAFRIARGDTGDLALSLTEDGVLDGFSAEVEIQEYATDPADPTVNLVTAGTLVGVALTATPAFSGARVASVAATAPTGGPPMEDCLVCGTKHAIGAPCATTLTAEEAGAVRLAFRQALKITTPPTSPAVEPVEPPAVVSPQRPGARVAEPVLYGFHGHRGTHDFSTDLFASLRHNDGEATQRVEMVMTQTFTDDVSTGDVNELNPTRNRPDLYVDNLDYLTPVWNAINKGSIPDSTPFTLPKFNSATTVVAAHSEGTEPTAGVFTTTGQTIAPSAMSGKFEITRETIDQGGNPQVSTLIWGEIKRAYAEALEVAAVAMLDALSPTAITLSGTDADLDQDVIANIAALQFVRGGNRFANFFLASNLFTALAGAVDDNGRRLYPVVAPSNTGGTAAGNYATLQVGSLTARPAWALEVGNGGDGSSYLFNSSDCHGWATPPRRFDFEYEVKSVWLGVMGYLALANTRLDGVREVTYSA
jgi:phage head maturation protease